MIEFNNNTIDIINRNDINSITHKNPIRNSINIFPSTSSSTSSSHEHYTNTNNYNNYNNNSSSRLINELNLDNYSNYDFYSNIIAKLTNEHLTTCTHNLHNHNNITSSNSLILVNHENGGEYGGTGVSVIPEILASVNETIVNYGYTINTSLNTVSDLVSTFNETISSQGYTNATGSDSYDDQICTDVYDPTLKLNEFEFWVSGVILNLVGILGIFGNILSMVILSRPQMRSSINYLLIGLARCDTVLIITSMLLFGIPAIYPYTGYLFYYYYYIYPNISPCLYPIAMASQTASVYLTFTVTLERYVAVCHPLRARALCTYGRAKVYVIICIIFALLYNLPRFWEVIVIAYSPNDHDHTNHSSSRSNSINSSINNNYIIYNSSYTATTATTATITATTATTTTSGSSSINIYNYYSEINNNDVIFCVTASKLRRNTNYIRVYIHWCYLFFIYFIPFFSLAILNCLIYRQVQKANKERQRLSRTEKREIGLATMLLCVVVVFFLLNFLALYTNILEAFYDIINDFLVKTSNLLVTINSSANFIIYVIFGEKFKRIFLLLFCKGRMTRDTPDLIHYESSISNGDGGNRSSGRFSRHGTQRSTMLRNGNTTSLRLTRSKRYRSPSPGPCVYYPARDLQRTTTILTPSASINCDWDNKNGGLMTSGF